MSQEELIEFGKENLNVILQSSHNDEFYNDIIQEFEVYMKKYFQHFNLLIKNGFIIKNNFIEIKNKKIMSKQLVKEMASGRYIAFIDIDCSKNSSLIIFYEDNHPIDDTCGFGLEFANASQEELSRILIEIKQKTDEFMMKYRNMFGILYKRRVKMLNQIVLVGRITKDPEIKELTDEKKVSNITLAVPRSYKNDNGEYETDFVDCTLWNGIAINTVEYCKKGDLVGIKGRVQTRKNNDKNVMEIVAEKVTFLSKTRSVNEDDVDKTDVDSNISI